MSKKYIVLMAAVGGLLFYLTVLFAMTTMMHQHYYKTEEYTIVQATDLHYYSASLTDYGEAFQKRMESGDGKLIQYTPQITEEFIDAMIEKDPDLVVLTGDLTYMGETTSHEELIRRLDRLREAGIPVLVIPGNHDINSDKAMSYFKKNSETVASPTEEEFAELYENYGYGEAIARHDQSLSYVYEVSEDTWILALDVNGYGTNGVLKGSTVRWARKQLKKAQKQKINVISMTHQNLRRHNTKVNDIYTMERAGRLQAAYHRYSLHFNLSGHIHMNHYKTVNELTDIATSSISLPPCQYGVVTEDGYNFEYHTEQLELSGIDKSENFDITCTKQITRSLENAEMGQSRIDELVPQLVEINKQYFAGHVTDLEKAQELLEILQEEAPDATWILMLESAVEDEGKDFTNYEFHLDTGL